MSNTSLVIKLGSQTIVNQAGELDFSQLEAIIHQIIELKKKGFNIILVSSGAVATGRQSTKDIRLKFQNIVEERQILASIGQAGLIETYNNILRKNGFIAAQILLTKEDFRSRNHYLNTYNLLHGLIKNPNVLPIVNENDVTSINELMFTDNDELSALIAIQMHVNKLIILTSIEGVYDQNPANEGAQLISTLDLNQKETWPKTLDGKSLYGRGGMSSKLACARKAAHFGIHTYIANARLPNVLQRVLNDEKIGTKILPFKQDKGIKRWLAHTYSDSLPSVFLNDGISRILTKREKAVSLLPVGITSINGTFEKDDLVSIKNEQGKSIGLGVARYDSRSLSAVIGQKDQKIFIHYNKICIFDNPD
ncbi:MAG: glutamate 5-kinase [Gammaproteobacteria bacterium 39-13]|nr:glutamate 5-kinase [Gammaproteobacteria bacterium]OJV88076.1 MAG: glutamate 5-kinase [Gammaproteobacteria bacterium 39-13]